MVIDRQLLASQLSTTSQMEVHDASKEKGSHDIATVLSSLCDILFATSPVFSIDKLLRSLTAVKQLESALRHRLGEVVIVSEFTRKELYVIQDASEGLYKDDDIEDAFFKHAGYPGIIVLILYFRIFSIDKQWRDIKVKELRGWLVRRTAAMLPQYISDWIAEYVNNRGASHDLRPHKLQYLGSHAGRKRQRRLQEEVNTITPEQENNIPKPSSSHAILAVKTSTQINPLVVLLYSLGCLRIREDILFRGLWPQKRWDACGNVCTVTKDHIEFPTAFALLFSDRANLKEALSSCTRLGSIEHNSEADGSAVYSISDHSRQEISQRVKYEELVLTGLTFTTYIFPRDPALEESFQEIATLVLPYLLRTWRLLKAEQLQNLPANLRDSLVEASLAIYKIQASNATREVDTMLAMIHPSELPVYLRMAVATRKSISLRFQGEYDQSDAVIQDALVETCIASDDIRSHCAFGRLLLSQTENAILRKEFEKAESTLGSWEIKGSSPSGMELQILRMKNTALGRVSRYMGDFEHARTCFEACLKMILDDASRFHIMHHLADVYCELKLPDQAEKLVLNEFEQLRIRDTKRSKAFRRLALSLIEAYIQQRKLEAAKALLLELQEVYERMANRDVSDELGHVRLMISTARISWYERRSLEALQTLESTLELAESYAKTFSERNFYKGIVYLFLAVVQFDLEQYSDGRLAITSANDILHYEIPRHFIPGLGSYFLQQLSQIKSSIQWAESKAHAYA